MLQTEHSLRVVRIAVIAWFGLAGALYVSGSIETILRYAPHVLYADQWRQYTDYLTLPFPINVLRPDNGHRLLLPNLIAWFEIAQLDGNQWLQIFVGIVCAFCAAALAATTSLGDRTVTPNRRAAAAFLCFLAIFWLANVRTLFHSVELLHTTLPMLCLMLALRATISATRQPNSIGQLLLAIVMAVLATFSFGYGMAVFVGIFGVLLARKASLRLLLAWSGGLATTALLYVFLPGRDGVTASMTLAPLENLLAAARWLGAPFMVLFKYLWEPGAAGLVPGGPLRGVTSAISARVAGQWPDIGGGVMPYALLGALGILALLVASFRRLRTSEAAPPMQAIGLGIAWFGFGAAGIVSLSRLGYFRLFPDQIYADRYLPWPCLFWLGLALVALGQTSSPRAWLPRATFAFALLMPLLAWPLQFGGTIYAALVRGTVDNLAVGSEVGVIDRDAPLGENVADEMMRGVPILRPLRVAQFADPANAWLGQTLPPVSAALNDAGIETRPINNNLLGTPGTAVTVHMAIDTSNLPDILPLIDDQSRVIGLVVRDARVQPFGYSGYAQGAHEAANLRIGQIP